MDAAGAVDAQTAPTAPWKTAQTAVSHSAHTLNRFLGEHEDDHASHTEFLTLPAKLIYNVETAAIGRIKIYEWH